MTDNGPQFRSCDFQAFSNTWMFNHTTTNPYHSQANGLAESSVKTTKKILKAAMAKGEDAWLGILAYRNTPAQGRDTTPAQRLFSRRTKTLLPTRSDLLALDVSLISQRKR